MFAHVPDDAFEESAGLTGVQNNSPPEPLFRETVRMRVALVQSFNERIRQANNVFVSTECELSAS